MRKIALIIAPLLVAGAIGTAQATPLSASGTLAGVVEVAMPNAGVTQVRHWRSHWRHRGAWRGHHYGWYHRPHYYGSYHRPHWRPHYGWRPSHRPRFGMVING